MDTIKKNLNEGVDILSGIISRNEYLAALEVANAQLDFDAEEATRVSAEMYDRLKAIMSPSLGEKELQQQRSKMDVDRKRRIQRGANPHHLGRQR